MLLDSEKPMLIEKPVALRSEQAKAFLRAARCPHNKMIGFNRRFYRPVLALKKELGTRTPKSVHVVVSEHLDHHRRNTGEDVIRHLVPFTSVHTIDLVQFLFENATVKAMYRTEEGEFVSYNGLLESGGMPIFLGINANDPSPVGFWVRFPDETWVLSPLETLRMYRGISVDASGPVRRYTPAICGEVSEEGPGKPGILEQMRAFLSGRYAEGARLEDCVRQLELIDEIRRA